MLGLQKYLLRASLGTTAVDLRELPSWLPLHLLVSAALTGWRECSFVEIENRTEAYKSSAERLTGTMCRRKKKTMTDKMEVIWGRGRSSVGLRHRKLSIITFVKNSEFLYMRM